MDTCYNRYGECDRILDFALCNWHVFFISAELEERFFKMQIEIGRYILGLAS